MNNNKLMLVILQTQSIALNFRGQIETFDLISLTASGLNHSKITRAINQHINEYEYYQDSRRLL